ncbi:hypothetical protein FB451DRAFT_1130376 [Mycena latifolia]|nr:hypothetical protein FB451DRAFT_1130376 [Mycena latifolia]
MPFAKTYDAFVPSSYQEFLALATFKPDYVAFETLRAVPLDPAHAASFEFSKKITPHYGFIHSIRCYYFSLALLYNGFPSGTPGVPQITFEELNRRLYHTCLLHDIGWTTTTEGREHPAHAMTFELHGGLMAYEHLHATAPDLDAHQVGEIVESIVLHSSLWASGTSSATKTLMTLSAFFDVCGFDSQVPGSFDPMFSRKTVQEIEKEYPRGKLAHECVAVLSREFNLKPDCLLTHLPGGRDAFFKSIRVEPLVPVDESISL